MFTFAHQMVRWLHNGLALTSGIDGYYLRLNFTLKISSVSARHVGSYCCAVEGSLVAKYCTEVLMNCKCLGLAYSNDLISHCR